MQFSLTSIQPSHCCDMLLFKDFKVPIDCMYHQKRIPDLRRETCHQLLMIWCWTSEHSFFWCFLLQSSMLVSVIYIYTYIYICINEVITPKWSKRFNEKSFTTILVWCFWCIIYIYDIYIYMYMIYIYIITILVYVEFLNKFYLLGGFLKQSPSLTSTVPWTCSTSFSSPPPGDSIMGI